MSTRQSSLDKKRMERNFSRHSHLYDKYAAIQRLTGDRLITRLPTDGIKNILEIGCGTGNYTVLLSRKFGEARIQAVDISRKMIEVAQKKLPEPRIEFLAGDAEEIKGLSPKITGRFDLVTSNAAFQWFENLERALRAYKEILVKDGLLTFSTFGPGTFSELGWSLRESLDKGISLVAGHFLERERLEMILRRIFREVTVREQTFQETYPSLLALLRAIKYTGTQGADKGAPNFLWTRGLVEKTEKVYLARFGEISVSYQVFFCQAKGAVAE
ncbi:MAG: malonyl-ACP O-methyltransferase BioC [Candidatus Omnitrophota bacterium]